MNKGKAGRPMAYDHLLVNLEPDRLYSPRSLANRAWQLQMLDATEITPAKARLRACDALRKMAARYLPEQEDGQIHRRALAWYGWRWMEIPGKTPRPMHKKPDKRRRLIARITRLVDWWQARPGWVERAVWAGVIASLLLLMAYREYVFEHGLKREAMRAYVELLQSRKERSEPRPGDVPSPFPPDVVTSD